MVSSNIKNWMLGLLCIASCTFSMRLQGQIDWSNGAIGRIVRQAAKTNNQRMIPEKSYPDYHLVATAQEITPGGNSGYNYEAFLDKNTSMSFKWFFESINDDYIIAITLDSDGLRRFYILKMN